MLKWSFMVMLMGLVILTACKRGAVVDPDDDDEPVGDALVEIFEWPSPSLMEFQIWPQADSSDYPAPEHSVLTSSQAADGFNWAIKNFSGDCEWDGVEPDAPSMTYDGLHRFRIDKEGYRPSFYYLSEEPEDCDIYHCAQDAWYDAECKSYDDFELMPENPSGVHELKYDMMVDPRYLSSEESDND